MNTALESLKFNNNQLTSLDVAMNTALIWLECWGNQLASIATIAALADKWHLRGVDVRNNKLDCGDWEDVKILQARLGEPVFKTVSGVTYLYSGFAYSPQKGLDPYNCETGIDNWAKYESIK